MLFTLKLLFTGLTKPPEDAVNSYLYLFILCYVLSVTSVVEFCGRDSTEQILAKKSVKFFDLTFTNADRQKLGTILESKVVQKLKFSKNDNNKKPSSKLIFFNEKKNQKDSNDF